MRKRRARFVRGRKNARSGVSLSDPDRSLPRAVIYGCAGTELTDEERRFFADSQPLGLILFGNNCEFPDQLTNLVASFRDAVERSDAPVLIDQEGGRVTRLKDPHWRHPLDAPPKAAKSSSSPAFRIQIASLRSEDAAKKAWGRLTKSHADLFGKLKPNIVRIDLAKKGTFYRLQAGPLTDAKAARTLCTRAKKRKIGCLVVRP